MRYAEREIRMKLTWLSLFYETGYLLVTGVFLLTAPDTAFNLLFSNNSYGDVLPRFLGTVLFSIGAIVQIVRMHIEVLYTTTIAFARRSWRSTYGSSIIRAIHSF